jgi:hypothetical protein
LDLLCESAVSGTMFTVIVRLLTPKLGYGWILLVVNSVKLATLIIALILVKLKVKPDQFYPMSKVTMLIGR